MTLMEAIEARISCRAYTDQPLDRTSLEELRTLADRLSAKGDARIVIVGPQDGGERLRLNGRMFRGHISTYAALVGPDTDLSREHAGYFGERLVLRATQLGLGTCWVAGTFDRDSVTLELREGEVLHCVIPIGQMPPRQPLAQRTIRAGLRKRGKKPEAIYQGPTKLAEARGWIRDGIEACLKGPSAVNGQPVVFVHDEGGLHATLPNRKRDVEVIDLGISKLHFQIAAEHAGVRGTWEWGDGGTFAPSER